MRALENVRKSLELKSYNFMTTFTLRFREVDICIGICFQEGECYRFLGLK